MRRREVGAWLLGYTIRQSGDKAVTDTEPPGK
jgi:hypothetical protein